MHCFLRFSVWSVLCLRDHQTTFHENIYWPCGVVPFISGLLAISFSDAVSVSNRVADPSALSYCRVDNRIAA